MNFFSLSIPTLFHETCGKDSELDGCRKIKFGDEAGVMQEMEIQDVWDAGRVMQDWRDTGKERFR